MRKSNVLVVVLLMLFFIGFGLTVYPYARGTIVDLVIEHDAADFLEQMEDHAINPTVPLNNATEPTVLELREYPELWAEMNAYNEAIYTEGQSGLSCETDYEVPSFVLAEYGLSSEIFAVLAIPALELEMPVYLGATNQHMADGAAHMSQTSLPIGGENTNTVVVGHRGWNGAAYFLHLPQLKIGDAVTITNLWETLTYEVVETRIIDPYNVEAIHIQEGRELLTLLTCHPPATGGRQRYLVFCERVT